MIRVLSFISNLLISLRKVTIDCFDVKKYNSYMMIDKNNNKFLNTNNHHNKNL